ncbi:MAG: hypothetical protein ACI35W_07215 [Anaeroplasmataceae bacterium]
MKKNLIFSIVSLCLATLLLIFTSYAWFTLNSVANAKTTVSVIGSTGDFTLFYWNDTSSRWMMCNDSISVDNLWPGESVYFKLVGNNVAIDKSLNVNLAGCSSELNTTIVTGAYNKTKAQYEVLYNNIKYYESETTTFTAGGKVLYELTEISSGYLVNLADYKIEDVFKIYTNPTIEDDIPVDKGTSSLDKLTDSIISEQTTSSSVLKYFTLSFDESGDDILDSYYQYQSLKISSIVISLM